MGKVKQYGDSGFGSKPAFPPAKAAFPPATKSPFPAAPAKKPAAKKTTTKKTTAKKPNFWQRLLAGNPGSGWTHGGATAPFAGAAAAMGAPAVKKSSSKPATSNPFVNSATIYNQKPQISHPGAAPGAGDEEGYPELEGFGGSFADYLAQYGGGGPVGDGGAGDIRALYDQQRQQAQGTFQAGNNDIGAMYAALARSLTTSNSADLANQEKLQAMSRDQTQQGQQALSDAYGDSNSRLSELAKNTGTADFSDPAAKTAAEYQDLNQSVNQAYGNTGAQQLLGNAQAIQREGTGNISAAQFGGARRQAELAAKLQEYLNGLGNDETQALIDAKRQAQQDAAASEDAGYKRASDAWDRDYGQWKDYQSISGNRDDEAWDRSIDKRKLDQADAAAAAKGSATQKYVPGPQGAMQYLAASPGMTKNSRDAILSAIMKGSGSANTTGQSSAYGMHQQIQDAIDRGIIPANLANDAYAAADIYAQAKLN